MMPNMQMSTVATITTVLIIKFRCIDFCLIFCRYTSADLLRTFCRDQRTDSGAGELELQVIRFDSHYYSVIVDGGDGAHNTTRGNDGVARLQLGQHLGLALLLLLHGHKQQKI